MRVTSLLTLLLTLALAAPDQAEARSKAGVRMPDAITVAGKRLTLNGMGLREATMLKVDVYVAGLYLETPSSDPAEIIQSNQTKLLLLEFVRDVDRGDIVEAWSKGFEANATVPLSTLRPHIDQLNRWMVDMKDGQTLAFVYVPGQGVGVDVDGERKGMIESEDFARSLFAIWLGRKPPNSGLKTGLLGKR